MTDFIIAGLVLVILGVAVAYIVKAKKSGVKCIGCPAGGNCCGKTGSDSCTCGCHSDTSDEK